MKKILNKISVLMLGLLLVGPACTDLDEELFSAVTADNFFQTEEEFLQAGFTLSDLEGGRTLAGETSTIVIPQNPFYKKNGVKVQLTDQADGRGKTIRIEIKESLGFREIG